MHADGHISLEDDLIHSCSGEKIIVGAIKAVPVLTSGVGSISCSWVCCLHVVQEAILAFTAVLRDVDAGDLLYSLVQWDLCKR